MLIFLPSSHLNNVVRSHRSTRPLTLFDEVLVEETAQDGG